MPSSQTCTTLLLAALLGAALTARAQTPPPPPPPAAEPPALAALRAEFLSQVVAGSRQLTEQFSKALVKLEDELAAAGDYEDAIQVQNRRREIDSTLLSTAPVAPVEAGIAMPASAAKASSSVTIESGELTGWRVTGSSAEWTMQRMTPGRYTVRLSYILADAPPNGEPSLSARFSAVAVAKFKFSEVSLLGAAAANTRLLELARSEDPLTWSALTTEPITISRSSITLKIEALQGYAANIVRIKDIRLVPVEETPALPLAATPSGAATGEKDVETLRQLFTKQFAAARAPLAADYKARLKTLAAQPSVTKDQDLIELIEAEQKRVGESTASSPGMLARRRGGAPGGPGGIDGFEDISGARLVADPANTADRFKIEHGGQQRWIKLAWVRCPPATDDDKEALQAATRHFKIDEAEALEIGRVAREFSLGYIEDRPLRLLVRGKKKTKDDAAPALVFLDDLGMLFQMVLIDRGFAAFAPPPGTDRRPMTELAMMKMLSDHEQQAMKRNPAPGAWSFQTEGAK